MKEENRERKWMKEEKRTAIFFFPDNPTQKIEAKEQRTDRCRNVEGDGCIRKLSEASRRAG